MAMERDSRWRTEEGYVLDVAERHHLSLQLETWSEVRGRVSLLLLALSVHLSR